MALIHGLLMVRPLVDAVGHLSSALESAWRSALLPLASSMEPMVIRSLRMCRKLRPPLRDETPAAIPDQAPVPDPVPAPDTTAAASLAPTPEPPTAVSTPPEAPPAWPGTPPQAVLYPLQQQQPDRQCHRRSRRPDQRLACQSTSTSRRIGAHSRSELPRDGCAVAATSFCSSGNDPSSGGDGFRHALSIAGLRRQFSVMHDAAGGAGEEGAGGPGDSLQATAATSVSCGTGWGQAAADGGAGGLDVGGAAAATAAPHRHSALTAASAEVAAAALTPLGLECVLAVHRVLDTTPRLRRALPPLSSVLLLPALRSGRGGVRKDAAADIGTASSDGAASAATASGLVRGAVEAMVGAASVRLRCEHPQHQCAVLAAAVEAVYGAAGLTPAEAVSDLAARLAASAEFEDPDFDAAAAGAPPPPLLPPQTQDASGSKPQPLSPAGQQDTEEPPTSPAGPEEAAERLDLVHAALAPLVAVLPPSLFSPEAIASALRARTQEQQPKQQQLQQAGGSSVSATNAAVAAAATPSDAARQLLCALVRATWHHQRDIHERQHSLGAARTSVDAAEALALAAVATEALRPGMLFGGGGVSAAAAAGGPSLEFAAGLLASLEELGFRPRRRSHMEFLELCLSGWRAVQLPQRLTQPRRWLSPRLGAEPACAADPTLARLVLRLLLRLGHIQSFPLEGLVAIAGRRRDGAPLDRLRLQQLMDKAAAVASGGHIAATTASPVPPLPTVFLADQVALGVRYGCNLWTEDTDRRPPPPPQRDGGERNGDGRDAAMMRAQNRATDWRKQRHREQQELPWLVPKLSATDTALRTAQALMAAAAPRAQYPAAGRSLPSATAAGGTRSLPATLPPLPSAPSPDAAAAAFSAREAALGCLAEAARLLEDSISSSKRLWEASSSAEPRNAVAGGDAAGGGGKGRHGGSNKFGGLYAALERAMLPRLAAMEAMAAEQVAAVLISPSTAASLWSSGAPAPPSTSAEAAAAQTSHGTWGTAQDFEDEGAAAAVPVAAAAPHDSGRAAGAVPGGSVSLPRGAPHIEAAAAPPAGGVGAGGGGGTGDAAEEAAAAAAAAAAVPPPPSVSPLLLAAQILSSLRTAIFRLELGLELRPGQLEWDIGGGRCKEMQAVLERRILELAPLPQGAAAKPLMGDGGGGSDRFVASEGSGGSSGCGGSRSAAILPLDDADSAWPLWSPEQQDLAAAASRLLPASDLGQQKHQRPDRRFGDCSRGRCMEGGEDGEMDGSKIADGAGGTTALTPFQSAAVRFLPYMRPRDVVSSLEWLQRLGLPASALPAAELAAAGQVVIHGVTELTEEDLLKVLAVAAWVTSGDQRGGAAAACLPWYGGAGGAGISLSWSLRGSRNATDVVMVVGKELVARERLKRSSATGSAEMAPAAGATAAGSYTDGLYTAEGAVVAASPTLAALRVIRQAGMSHPPLALAALGVLPPDHDVRRGRDGGGAALLGTALLPPPATVRRMLAEGLLGAYELLALMFEAANRIPPTPPPPPPLPPLPRQEAAVIKNPSPPPPLSPSPLSPSAKAAPDGGDAAGVRAGGSFGTGEHIGDGERAAAVKLLLLLRGRLYDMMRRGSGVAEELSASPALLLSALQEVGSRPLIREGVSALGFGASVDYRVRLVNAVRHALMSELRAGGGSGGEVHRPSEDGAVTADLTVGGAGDFAAECISESRVGDAFGPGGGIVWDGRYRRTLSAILASMEAAVELTALKTRAPGAGSHVNPAAAAAAAAARLMDAAAVAMEDLLPYGPAALEGHELTHTRAAGLVAQFVSVRRSYAAVLGALQARQPPSAPASQPSPSPLPAMDVATTAATDVAAPPPPPPPSPLAALERLSYLSRLAVRCLLLPLDDSSLLFELERHPVLLQGGGGLQVRETRKAAAQGMAAQREAPPEVAQAEPAAAAKAPSSGLKQQQQDVERQRVASPSLSPRPDPGSTPAEGRAVVTAAAAPASDDGFELLYSAYRAAAVNGSVAAGAPPSHPSPPPPPDDALWRIPALSLSPRSPHLLGQLPRTRALDPAQRDINMRLAAILGRAHADINTALAVLRLSYDNSQGIALPTQAALQLSLVALLPAASAPQLDHVLQLAARTRLFPPQLIHRAAKRALELYGGAAGGGYGGGDAAVARVPEGAGAAGAVDDSSGGDGNGGLLPLRLMGRLVHCMASLSPAAEVDVSLVRSVIRVAAAAAVRATAGEAAVAPGQSERQSPGSNLRGSADMAAAAAVGAVPAAAAPRPSISSGPSGADVAALVEGLVRDVQTVCDGMRPAPRNAILALIAPLRGAANRPSSETSLLQALFVEVLGGGRGGGGEGGAGGGSGQGSAFGRLDRDRRHPSTPPHHDRNPPSGAQLQLLVAHLPQLGSMPGLSWLVNRLLEAHEPYLDGSAQSADGSPGRTRKQQQQQALLPPWRHADALLRAAALSVPTLRLELVEGLQGRILRLPPSELMTLAARSGELRLLPPLTLAAIANRLRVYYSRGSGPAGKEAVKEEVNPNHNSVAASGTSAPAAAEAQPLPPYGNEEPPPPVSVAMSGLVEAIRQRMLDPRAVDGATGGVVASRASGYSSSSFASCSANAATTTSASLLRWERPIVTSDPPQLAMGLAHALAAALAADGEAALLLTRAARDQAGRVACALAAQALAAPPVRPATAEQPPAMAAAGAAAATTRLFRPPAADEGLSLAASAARAVGVEPAVVVEEAGGSATLLQLPPRPSSSSSYSSAAAATASSFSSLLSSDLSAHLRLLQVAAQQQRYGQGAEAPKLLRLLLAAALEQRTGGRRAPRDGEEYWASAGGGGGSRLDGGWRLGSSACDPGGGDTHGDGGGDGGGFQQFPSQGARLAWLLQVSRAVLTHPPTAGMAEYTATAAYLRRHSAAAGGGGGAAVAADIAAVAERLGSSAAPVKRQQQQRPLPPDQVLRQLQQIGEQVDSELAELGEADVHSLATAAKAEAAAAVDALADTASAGTWIPPLAAMVATNGRTVGDQLPGPIAAAPAVAGAALGVPYAALGCEATLCRFVPPSRAGGGWDDAAGMTVGTTAAPTARPSPLRGPLCEHHEDHDGDLRVLGAPKGLGQALSSGADGTKVAAAGASSTSAAVAAVADRRRFLYDLRDRLEVLKAGLDMQVVALMAPPPPRWLQLMEAEAAPFAAEAGAGTGGGGGGSRNLIMISLPGWALEHRLGLTRPGRSGAAAEHGAWWQHADEGVHDSVRQLLDELEVELASEAHAGALCEAAGWGGGAAAAAARAPKAPIWPNDVGSLGAGGGGVSSWRRRRLLMDSVNVLTLLHRDRLSTSLPRDGIAAAASVEARSRHAMMWEALMPPLLRACRARELQGPDDWLGVLEGLTAAPRVGAAATMHRQLADRLFDDTAVWLLRQVPAAAAPAPAASQDVDGAAASPSSSSTQTPAVWTAVEVYSRAFAAMRILTYTSHPALGPLQAAFAPWLQRKHLIGLVSSALRLEAERQHAAAAAAADAAAGAHAVSAAAAAVEAAAAKDRLLSALRVASPDQRVGAFCFLSRGGPVAAADGSLVEAVVDLLLPDLTALTPYDLVGALKAVATLTTNSASTTAAVTTASPTSSAATSNAATSNAAGGSVARGPAVTDLVARICARLKSRTDDCSSAQLATVLPLMDQLAAAGCRVDRAVGPALRRALITHLASPAAGLTKVAAVLQRLAAPPPLPPRSDPEGHFWLLNAAADAVLRMPEEEEGNAKCGKAGADRGGSGAAAAAASAAATAAAQLHLDVVEALARLGYGSTTGRGVGGPRWAALLERVCRIVRRRLQRDLTELLPLLQAEACGALPLLQPQRQGQEALAEARGALAEVQRRSDTASAAAVEAAAVAVAEKATAADARAALAEACEAEREAVDAADRAACWAKAEIVKFAAATSSLARERKSAVAKAKAAAMAAAEAVAKSAAAASELAASESRLRQVEQGAATEVAAAEAVLAEAHRQSAAAAVYAAAAEAIAADASAAEQAAWAAEKEAIRSASRVGRWATEATKKWADIAASRADERKSAGAREEAAAAAAAAAATAAAAAEVRAADVARQVAAAESRLRKMEEEAAAEAAVAVALAEGGGAAQRLWVRAVAVLLEVDALPADVLTASVELFTAVLGGGEGGGGEAGDREEERPEEDR